MIFDTHWEDTRAFACAYFENFEPLSADDMVVIADSNYNDVQQFAKKIIKERDFNQEDLLLKLSQHPSLSIQKFVTDLMLHEVSSEALLKMERFFNTLLHSVNRNRVAKTRILMILKEHLENEAIAQMVGRLLSHHCATMVWEDKEQYVAIMDGLKASYPEIALPLIIKKTEKREAV
jgi:hypothetical protein